MIVMFTEETLAKLAELAKGQAEGNQSLFLRRLIDAASLVAPRRLDQLAEEFAAKGGKP